MTDDWKLAAKEMDALKDSGKELDGLERVNARVSKSPRSVVSLRMGPDELKEIMAAAAVLDQNASEFIRQSALTRAREVAVGANQARQVLEEYVPTRYRPDMSDEEVFALMRELRAVLLDAFSLVPAKSA